MCPLDLENKAQKRKRSIADSPSSTATSPTLLRQAATGDADAWERLVNLYGPLVFHWARQQGIADHDAADILQDVFASVSRSLQKFETRNAGSFRAWLWVITRNQLMDLFRRRSKEAQALGGSAAWQQLATVAESLSDDPDQFTSQDQLTSLHQRGLDLVKSEFEQRTWQIFWQATIEEQPTSEVAEQFGISSNAVRQAKSRVLRRLRQILGDVSPS